MASIAGCSDERGQGRQYGPGSLEAYETPVRTLNGRVLTADERLGRPFTLAVTGPRLVVIDNASELAVHVYHSSDGRHVRSFGRRGAGPGEFKGPWSVATRSGSPDDVWIFDIALNRLTRAPLDAERAAIGSPEIVNFHDVLPTGPLWMGDSLIVSSGFFSRGRLARFSPSGEFLAYVGALPPGAEETPITVRQHAYVGTAVKNDARARLAIATRHSDQLEILRPNGTLVTSARGPFAFAPRFTVERRGENLAMSTDESLRFGYVHAAASDDRIYALFSGRTREGFGSRAPFGQYIHVFDWDGKLREVLRVDTDLLALGISDDGRTLYAIRHDPTPALLAYSLPEI